MRKLFSLLLSALGLITSGCEIAEPRQPVTASQAVSYEYEPPEPDDPSPDDANARLAATPSGNVAVQSITNDLDFAQAYTVQFWYFGSTEPQPSNRFDNSPVLALPPKKQPKLYSKSNLRYYGSKSLKAGWWMAKGSGSEVLYKLNVTAGAKAMLQIDDENNPAFGTGFSATRGKVKVSLWGKTAKPSEADITIAGRSYHLFSCDGAGSYKYVSWYLPAGTYSAAWTDAVSQPKTVSISITTNGKYPHIKLNS